MKLKMVIALLLVVSGKIAVQAQGRENFDRSLFYAAMASENVESIDTRLIECRESSILNKDAFEGALLMKKAGLVSNSKNKLNLFKSGRKKLEYCLSIDPKNAELRFLRLMIQEHAPKILNYHGEIDEDSQFIRKLFKSLSPVVQQAIIDYSKKSRVLNPAIF